MPSTYSNNLGLTLIANGEQAGQWGDTTNTNLGSLIEQAISGYTAVSMTSDADRTLTSTVGVINEARSMGLNITSTVTLTATRNIIVPTLGSAPSPAPFTKLYVVRNATTGGQSIVVKTLAGTGITIAPLATAIVLCNGTDVIDPFSAKLNTTGGTLTGGLTFSGSGTRIQGDFSTATYANRTAFQDKTTNNGTSIYALPNGTSTESYWNAFNTSDPANGGYVGIGINSSEAALYTSKQGTGGFVPLKIQVGGVVRITLQTDGAFIFYNEAGTRTASLDTSGNLIVKGNVTAYGNP